MLRFNLGGIRIRKFLFYFVWAIIIGLITSIGGKYQRDLLNMESSSIFYILFSIILPVIIGVLVKLPNFISEQGNKWGFDWIKFSAIAIPYIYLIVVSILPFTDFGEGVIAYPQIISNGGSALITIAGVVLGYIFLDSLKKTN